MTLRLRGWNRPTGTPQEKVFAALLRVREQGVGLRFGDFGVSMRRLQVVGWHRTNMGVNLVGAVLLAFQPEALPDSDCAHEDPVEAAARALEGPPAFVAGMSDGWERAAHSREWLGSVHKGVYLNGYETGMFARFRETTVCSCGTRRFLVERTCPSCDR